MILKYASTWGRKKPPLIFLNELWTLLDKFCWEKKSHETWKSGCSFTLFSARTLETAAQHDLNYFYGAVKCGWATRTIIFLKHGGWWGVAFIKALRNTLHDNKCEIKREEGVESEKKKKPVTHHEDRGARNLAHVSGHGCVSSQNLFAVNNNNNKGNKPIIPSWKTAAIICNYVNKTFACWNYLPALKKFQTYKGLGKCPRVRSLKQQVFFSFSGLLRIFLLLWLFFLFFCGKVMVGSVAAENLQRRRPCSWRPFPTFAERFGIHIWDGIFLPPVWNEKKKYQRLR